MGSYCPLVEFLLAHILGVCSVLSETVPVLGVSWDQRVQVTSCGMSTRAPTSCQTLGPAGNAVKHFEVPISEKSAYSRSISRKSMRA